MSAYLVLSVPSISGLRFCLKVDSWHCLPSNTGIYSNRAVHVWMIRLCFSHFPIAEPKNSSPSLELCHAESFLFVFFVLGVIKAAQAVQNKRKEALLLLNMMVKLWYDHPHISLTPLSKTAGSDEKAVCEIGTDTPLHTYQSVWEPAHPDTVLRYGQPDTMFNTKASTHPVSHFTFL